MNERHKRFVEEYIKDLNASAASIRAGYSKNGANVTGSKLLAMPNILDAVKEAIDKRAIRTEVSQDWVIKRLKQIAGSDMADIADWNASGVTFKDSSSLSEDARASVQTVEETTNEHGGSLKVKQHDKIKALELIGRHLNMFKDTVNLPDGAIRLIIEDYSKKK